MSGLNAQDKKALDLFSAQVKATFADRVEQMQLFGSKARGDATKFSDVDVLVILQGSTREDRRRVSNITSDILGETGIWLSPHTMSPEHFDALKQRRSMFWQSIKPDLVAL